MGAPPPGAGSAARVHRPGPALRSEGPAVAAPAYLARVLELLLPTRCSLCQRGGTALCGSCVCSLPPAPELAAPPGIEGAWSLLEYRDTTKRLVAALKYRNHRDALTLLGDPMAALVERPVDVVTWAPTSSTRVRRRGYDQAELLARAVARALGRPAHRLLRRVNVEAQTGRGRADRLGGPAFCCVRRTRGSALIVDDVRTTGATLCAASDALLGAGAARTFALTLAATP